jgi:hypothetical protein
VVVVAVVRPCLDQVAQVVTQRHQLTTLEVTHHQPIMAQVAVVVVETLHCLLLVAQVVTERQALFVCINHSKGKDNGEIGKNT